MVKRWSKDEIDKLKYLYYNNNYIWYIAEVLGRTESEIVRKLEDLGIYRESKGVIFLFLLLGYLSLENDMQVLDIENGCTCTVTRDYLVHVLEHSSKSFKNLERSKTGAWQQVSLSSLSIPSIELEISIGSGATVAIQGNVFTVPIENCKCIDALFMDRETITVIFKDKNDKVYHVTWCGLNPNKLTDGINCIAESEA